MGDAQTNMTIESAIDEIESWARKQPKWITEAIRLIAKGQVITDQQASDLADLSIKEAADSLEITALEAEELKFATRSSPVMVLKSVSETQNVNRIAPNSNLSFDESGLTIVYGENGAGKSGFTRILRQVCRVRGESVPLLSNVFEPMTLDISAKIQWVAGGNPDEATWKLDQPFKTDLKHVSIFDSHVAVSHTKEAGPIPGTPFPVEVLEKLGQAVLLKVRAVLTARLESAQAALVPLPEVSDNDELNRVLETLGSGTSADELVTRFTLSADEKAELETQRGLLKTAVSDSPDDQVKSLRRQLAEIELLEAEVKRLDTLFNADAAKESLAEGAALKTKRAAAATARALLEGNELPSVGGEVWRSMWEHARKFSTDAAYPGIRFPNTGEGAVCVLCEQPLSVDAAHRLDTLEMYVSSTSQATLDSALTDLNTYVRQFENDGEFVKLTMSSELSDALANRAPSLESIVKDLGAEALSSAKSHVKARQGTAEPKHLAALVSTPAAKALETDKAKVTERIKALESSDNGQTIATIKAAIKQLEDREIVIAAAATLSKRESQLAEISHLLKAVKSCATNSTTVLTGKLSSALVSESLSNYMSDELKALGADRLKVSVSLKSVKTVTTHRLVLTDSQGAAVVSSVLSEGEARAIALAAFFTELKFGGSGSGIVLDDPVSSLDHKFRERVAKRITQEAQHRQVVVFTHDLVFLEELVESSRLLGKSPGIRTLIRKPEGVGALSSSLPIAGSHLEIQIQRLSETISAAQLPYESEDGTWETTSRGLAGDLRIAWERGVEEIFLEKSVIRFRHSVQTTRLRKVEINDELWARMERAMSVLSAKGPHDMAGAVMGEPLSHPELNDALKELISWKTEVRKNAKLVEARRDHLVAKAGG